MLKIIPMYIGVFLATLIMCYLINWTKYTEGVYFSPLVLLVFINGILIIQISILSLLTYLLGKKVSLNLFAFQYINFTIGFLFSFLYILFNVVVIPHVGFLNENWFILILLPVLIYLPLIFADYLYCQTK
jgi:hypothetical protein